MRKLYALGTSLLMSATAAVAQPSFTDGSAALVHSASSGGCMAVTDMDGDGRDDIVQLDMGTDVTILYQNEDHSFTAFDYGALDGNSQWGWAIADVDNNGHKDIMSGAYNSTQYLRITSRGVYTLSTLTGPSFTQCMSMADINNDGRVDTYACNDVGPNTIWITDVNGVPQVDNTIFNWATACTGTSGDMSGNYGSTFSDFDNDGDIDLYISHCRQGVNDADDCRRWNRLFVNDGTNHYSDLAADYGIDSHEQTWTSDFGDIDNDGDLDMFSTNHSTSVTLFKNDGTGHFTNVTAGSGLENMAGFMLQGLFRDLDNDGSIDIMIAGGVEGYFKNNGDGTFARVTGLFPSAKAMHGFAFGDLNQDGFEDVYANYGDGYVDGATDTPDRIWMNTPNGNHWFNVNLEGVVSNRDAVGARVTITGPWGTQVREVHAGESYGLVNSFTLHFGLGANTEVTTMSIHWPSGLVENFNDLHGDQTMTVVEGECISPNAHITTPGATALCTGGAPITLTADPGFTYNWSTNASSQSITVSQPGIYSVMVSGSGQCVTQASITIVMDPDQTPSITTAGNTTICEFDHLVLTASPSPNYTWSDGSHGQTLTVNTQGTYSVTVDGACANFTSAGVDVEVLDAPNAPASSDVSIPAPGTAQLTATGDSLVWYDAAVDGNVVGTGSPWTTPSLNATTSFWCADVTQYGGAVSYGGAENKTTIGAYPTTGGYYLVFTAYQDMVINSVKVYSNLDTLRNIALVDATTGAVITSGTFSIPNGESRVTLNFTAPAGGPYGLRINGGNPHLWRDQSGSNPAYPFALGTLGSITTSSVAGNGTAYYYFFYDWEVSTPASYCAGPRTQAVVHVGPVGITETDLSNGMHVFPNPASDLINISLDGVNGTMDADLLDIAGRVVMSKRMNIGNAMLDVKALAAGEYTLRVRHAAGTSVSRVVVQ